MPPFGRFRIRVTAMGRFSPLGRRRQLAVGRLRDVRAGFGRSQRRLRVASGLSARLTVTPKVAELAKMIAAGDGGEGYDSARRS